MILEMSKFLSLFILLTMFSIKSNAKIVGILTERFLINNDVCEDCGFENSDSYILDSKVINAVKFSCEKNDIMVVMIPNKDSDASNYVKNLDGIVIPHYKIPINPKIYGQHSTFSDKILIQHTSQYETQIIKSFIDAKKPILGINRGMQVINISHASGNLMQKIPKNLGKHNLDQDETHEVLIGENAMISGFFLNQKSIQTNSIHSQAVDEIGKGLVVSGKSIEGLTEAIESSEKDFFEIGVQWNPENLSSIDDVRVFDAFCRAVKNFPKTKN